VYFIRKVLILKDIHIPSRAMLSFKKARQRRLRCMIWEPKFAVQGRP
jgi:hypothetical protein